MLVLYKYCFMCEKGVFTSVVCDLLQDFGASVSTFVLALDIKDAFNHVLPSELVMMTSGRLLDILIVSWIRNFSRILGTSCSLVKILRFLILAPESQLGVFIRSCLGTADVSLSINGQSIVCQQGFQGGECALGFSKDSEETNPSLLLMV